MAANVSYNVSMEKSGQNATTDAPYPWYSIDYKIPKILAYCLLFFISVFGNSFIIWTINKDRRLKYTTNLLVANMALSDLLSTTFAVPLRIIQISYDDRIDLLINNPSVSQVLCKILPFVSELSRTVSVYSCVAIAIDRYRAVVFPMKRGFRRSRLRFIIPAIWMYASILSSPFLYFIELKEFHCEHIYPDTFNQFYEIHTSIVNIVPLPIITIIYILIVYKLKAQKIPGQQRDVVRKKRHQQNMKVLKMSAAVVSLLYVTYALHGTVVLLIYNDVFKDVMAHTKMSVLLDFRYTMVYIIDLSFCYNFFVYLIFNRIYRDNFKKVFGKCVATHAHYRFDRAIETPFTDRRSTPNPAVLSLSVAPATT